MSHFALLNIEKENCPLKRGSRWFAVLLTRTVALEANPCQYVGKLRKTATAVAAGTRVDGKGHGAEAVRAPPAYLVIVACMAARVKELGATLKQSSGIQVAAIWVCVTEAAFPRLFIQQVVTDTLGRCLVAG